MPRVTVGTMSLEGDRVEPIGELIRARRHELGLSLNDVASAVGCLDQPTVTGSEIARWERGKRIPRTRARQALAHALGLSVRVLDLAAASQRSMRASGDRLVPIWRGPPTEAWAVDAIRAAMLDNAASTVALSYDEDDQPPGPSELRAELADVMAAYQASRYTEMLELLPELLTGAHRAVDGFDGPEGEEAQRITALTGQAAAMVLTKLGERDLAWMASERGLAAARSAGDEAVISSLCRSVVHTLQSHGRVDAATRLTESTADSLRHIAGMSDRLRSVHGTLLLAGAMAAARAGDRSGVSDDLAEADAQARLVGHDANHLWTAFGPTNVAIHRVATAVALDDIDSAESHADVDPSRLPTERRVRYAFDLAHIRAQRRKVDQAVDSLIEAERLASEQVHRHVISRQIVADLCRTRDGKRDQRLARLAQRMQAADARSVGSNA